MVKTSLFDNHPVLDIVRERTGNGARIVDFFLNLMEGRVDDAKLCHRTDAAKQLVKYGHKGAAAFIADHSDEPCERRKRGPRSPRKRARPRGGVDVPSDGAVAAEVFGSAAPCRNRGFITEETPLISPTTSRSG